MHMHMRYVLCVFHPHISKFAYIAAMGCDMIVEAEHEDYLMV